MNCEKMNCKEIWTSLSDYVDGELSEELCQKIEQHLAGCEHCRVVVDTLTQTIYLCHCEADDTDLPVDVRGRLFESLHIEDYLKPK